MVITMAVLKEMEDTVKERLMQYTLDGEDELSRRVLSGLTIVSTESEFVPNFVLRGIHRDFLEILSRNVEFKY